MQKNYLHTEHYSIPGARRSFGKVLLKGTPETLLGYRVREIQIEEEFGLINYPIIVKTENPEDTIQGIVYDVTTNDLLK